MSPRDLVRGLCTVCGRFGRATLLYHTPRGGIFICGSRRCEDDYNGVTEEMMAKKKAAGKKAAAGAAMEAKMGATLTVSPGAATTPATLEQSLMDMVNDALGTAAAGVSSAIPPRSESTPADFPYLTDEVTSAKAAGRLWAAVQAKLHAREVIAYAEAAAAAAEEVISEVMATYAVDRFAVADITVQEVKQTRRIIDEKLLLANGVEADVIVKSRRETTSTYVLVKKAGGRKGKAAAAMDDGGEV